MAINFPNSPSVGQIFQSAYIWTGDHWSAYTPIHESEDLPEGSVVAINVTSSPQGYFVCNGQNGTYDLRGEFIRGLDDGKGVDSGRVIGSTQGYAYGTSTTTVSISTSSTHTHTRNIHYCSGAIGGAGDEAPSKSADTSTDSGGSHSHSVTVTGSSSETRPRNMSVQFVRFSGY